MAVEPMAARCGNCGRRLLLSEVATTAGRCPTREELLAPGYTGHAAQRT